MRKKSWKELLGLSNSQRQLSRKLGIPLSGRKSRKSLLPRASGGKGGGKAGCLVLFALVGAASLVAWLV